MRRPTSTNPEKLARLGAQPEQQPDYAGNDGDTAKHTDAERNHARHLIEPTSAGFGVHPPIGEGNREKTDSAQEMR